jgi:hypothetical protein
MREHERKRRPQAEPEAAEAQRAPLHNVLALQRSAGNQAVTAMLAREPETEKAYGTVALTSIGAIAILSFSMDTHSPPNKSDTREFQFVSRVGTHSDKLSQALLKGTVHDAEVEVGGGRMKVKMENAMVSAYQVSDDAQGGGPVESWSLVPSVTRIDDGSGGGGGGGGSWDLNDRSRG